jgi:hypothetical protein
MAGVEARATPLLLERTEGREVFRSWLSEKLFRVRGSGAQPGARAVTVLRVVATGAVLYAPARMQATCFPLSRVRPPSYYPPQSEVEEGRMSLESFYHEVALRQASADRDNLKFKPPWWRRCLAALSPAMKRLLVIIAAAALAAAGWWSHPHIHQYALGGADHPPGAADALAAVTRLASPAERAHRLVLACARENNPHACQLALQRALTIAQPSEVASWLKEKEVHALRVNAYFERFAATLEKRPDMASQPAATPARSAVPMLPPRAPETRSARAASSVGSSATAQSLRMDSSGFLSTTPNRNTDHLLGSSVSARMGTAPSPHASLDVSSARFINPSDAVNAPPIKKKPDNAPYP